MAIKQKPALAANKQSLDGSANKNDTLRIVSLITGDILVFLIFATIGRNSHDEAVGLNALGAIITTAFPFLLGWFLVSPWLGAFRRDIMIDPKKMARRTALAWLCSWPVAMLIRGLLVDHAVPPPAFWIVTLISNIILLALWRLPFAAAQRSRVQRQATQRP
jgi:hypothetical protein